MNLFDSGTWSNLPNGDRIWRINLQAKGAKFAHIIFDQFYMPEGGELFLYNDDRTDKIGPYTNNENQDDGILGSWMIEGDNLWVEYYEPAQVVGQGRVSISSFTYGYKNIYSEVDSIAKA